MGGGGSGCFGREFLGRSGGAGRFLRDVVKVEREMVQVAAASGLSAVGRVTFSCSGSRNGVFGFWVFLPWAEGGVLPWFLFVNSWLGFLGSDICFAAPPSLFMVGMGS